MRSVKYVALMLAVIIGVVSLSSSALAQSKKTKKASEKPAATQESSGKKEATMEQSTPKSNRPQYVITVTHGGKPLGSITIEMFTDIAPKHAANFDSLVAAKFYDGTAFHRVISGFMIQGGDPNSKGNAPKQMWGMGQPSQTRVPAEFSNTPHTRGIISAARMGNDVNSATSQFFICHGDAPFLNGQYTVYGQVLGGMEVVDKIANVPCERSGGGEISSPIEKVEMTIVKK